MSVRYFAVYADGRRVELLPDDEGFVRPPLDALHVEAVGGPQLAHRGITAPAFGTMMVDMGKKS